MSAAAHEMCIVKTPRLSRCEAFAKYLVNFQNGRRRHFRNFRIRPPPRYYSAVWQTWPAGPGLSIDH